MVVRTASPMCAVDTDPVKAYQCTEGHKQLADRSSMNNNIKQVYLKLTTLWPPSQKNVPPVQLPGSDLL